MRISDWSSDVCSSDLIDQATHGGLARRYDVDGTMHRGMAGCVEEQQFGGADAQGLAGQALWPLPQQAAQGGVDLAAPAQGHGHPPRSEEHTSELQSLMRISYAVFCLKKKNQHQHTYNDIIHTTQS